MTCPSCGAQAESGNFCGSCGAVLSQRPCANCGRALNPGARFCQQCGVMASGGGGGSAAGTGRRGEADRRPLLFGAAGLLALAVVAALFWVARGSNAAPAVAEPAAAAPPASMPSAAELAAMSPTERFNRLYNRVMTAAENGDTQTMETFSSMALLAYAQLDTVDADARYHAALLRVHTGDTAGALALADSIEADVPTHLFGSVVRGMVARFGGDQPGLEAAEAKFLRNWDAEMAAGRREYGEHRGMLDEFRQRAGAGS